MKISMPASKAYISDPDVERITRSTRALFAAILKRALKDVCKSSHNDYDLYQKQALHWIKVNDQESFKSFVNICNYLDIDVDQVRRSVYIEMRKCELGMQSQPSVSVDRQWAVVDKNG